MATIFQEFNSSPRVAIVLLVVLIQGGIINLIGFASPYWSEITVSLQTAHSGLWQYCLPDILGGCRTITQTDVWLRTIRAMMTLGFLTSLVAGAILLLFILTSRYKLKRVAILIVLACVGSVIFNGIGLAIYADKSGGFAWAFYLCWVGTAFFLLCSVLAGLIIPQLRI